MKIISRKEAIEQGLSFYFTGKPCKYGHTSERSITKHCVECKKEIGARYYAANKDKSRAESAKYYAANKERVKAAAKKWHAENPEKVKIAIDKWRSINKDKARARTAKYKKENPEKSKASNAKYNKANPERQFIRNSLNRIFSNWKGGRAKYESLLGYSYSDLKAHIERQFLKGMNWENRSEWHIDHITPISYYLKNGVTDPKVINCLSNLRPMWAKDNMSKGAATTLLC